MPDEQLNAEKTAKLLLITTRQLRNLVERGLPKHGHGKNCYYLWAEVFPWYIDYKLALAKPQLAPADGETPALHEAQAQKYFAEAQRAEIKLARERGEVVSIKDVEVAVSQANSNVRARMLAITAKLTPTLAATSSKPKVKAILDAEIHEALSELAETAGNVEIPDETEEEDDDVQVNA
jgi:phage terminase Nu1 subunit (DNA packaging protein)